LSYVSPSAARPLGYDCNALQGTNLLDLVHPADADTVLAWLHSSQSLGKPETTEFRLRNRAGHWVWMESDVRNLLADPRSAVWCLMRAT
jgi:PAS domain S-box-containing protein